MKLAVDYLEDYSERRYQSVDNHRLLVMEPFQKKLRIFSNRHLSKNFRTNRLVKQLVKGSMQVRRIDFLSRYQEHNDSPSARNLHSALLLFVYQKQVYYYDLFQCQLYNVGQTNAPFFEQDYLYVLGLHTLKNLCRYYGEFALYLSLLDGGHLLANVKNCLYGLENDFELTAGLSWKSLFGEVEVEDNRLFLSFAVKVSLTEALESETFPPVEQSRKTKEAYNYLKYSRYIDRLLLDFNTEGRRTKWIKRKPGTYRHFSEATFLNRTSAHNMVGNYNKITTYEGFSIEEALVELEKIKANYCSSALQYAFIVNTRDRLMIWKDGGQVEENGNFGEILYNDHDFFDLATYRIAFVCYSSRQETLNEGIVQQLLSVGEAMQFVGVLAAEQGYAFRPMKNHNDDYLKKIMQLTAAEDIQYIGVLCDESVQQLSVKIQ